MNGVIRFVVNTIIRLLLHITCRCRVQNLSRLPMVGPAIIAMNHINFVELPLLYFKFKPRRIVGLAKTETFDSAFLRVLGNLWEAVPLCRGGVDTKAFARAAAEMQRGALIGIAPEGTRSRHGRLRRANAGIVTLAAQTSAPVYPVAQWGGEQLISSLKRLRRVLVRVRIGTPIYVDLTARDGESARSARERELTRIMTAVARMLPARYRGYYAEAAKIAGSSSDNQ